MTVFSGSWYACCEGKEQYTTYGYRRLNMHAGFEVRRLL